MRPSFTLLAAWVLLCVVFELAVMVWQSNVVQEDLERESRTLINLLSQRVDQHDAHMTSLSALSQVGIRPDQSSFLEVAATIQRFYPRITAMDLVAIDPSQGTSGVPITTRIDDNESRVTADAVRQAAKGTQGELVLLPSPADLQRYLIVKRSPNNDQARFYLALEIDADVLLSERSDYWSKPNLSLTLSLPDNTLLSKRRGVSTPGNAAVGLEKDPKDQFNGDKEAGFFSTRSFSEPLSSRTQPLELTANFTLDVFDLLPMPLSVIGPVVIAIFLALSGLIHRLIRRTETAELNASLSVNEARISHASRVNSLGEMASGMAHELNQPLTAVLGQSQAGLRLLDRADVDIQRVAKVLDANVTQAKRASEILSRLRNWSSRKTHETTLVSINESIANVVALVDHDASHHSVSINFLPDTNNPVVKADAVEIEQVIFNLVRNALESFDSPEVTRDMLSASDVTNDPPDFHKYIEIATVQSNDSTRIQIVDNGRGISKELSERLFEPFATDKPSGMGLGLALCMRIVERYNGSIEVIGNDKQGATASITFPAVI